MKADPLHQQPEVVNQAKMQQLLNIVQHWKGWILVRTLADTAHTEMHNGFFIPLRVANLQFANEVLIRDDRFSGKNFKLLPVALVVEDWKTNKSGPPDRYRS
jgi:hypothetical protein